MNTTTIDQPEWATQIELDGYKRQLLIRSQQAAVYHRIDEQDRANKRFWIIFLGFGGIAGIVCAICGL